MPTRLADLSLAEIKNRYVDGGDPPSPQLLNRLKRDPRRGARAVYQQLLRRHEEAQEARRRLTSLLAIERVLWEHGVERVAGVDEAGVGPLAGPVVAAAVVFPPGSEIAGVDDSKKLDTGERERLAGEIRAAAAGVGVGVARVAEIDRHNVYQASLLAMRRAVEALPEAPQHLLIDARRIPRMEVPQSAFDGGDGMVFSIAAASIVAKTYRDALMCELDGKYPEYGFARHKGYGTEEHRAALAEHGPCDVHRLSYGAIREICGEFSERFYELRERLEECGGVVEALEGFERELEEVGGLLVEEERKKLRLMLRRRWGS